MKRLLAGMLALLLTFCFTGCKSDTHLSNSDTPENVAKISIEDWYEHNFESYLSTYPTFRLKRRALSFGGDRNADIKTVARAMSDYFDSAGRDVEILNVSVLEQHEFTDYTMYNELKEKYEDLTMEEFKTITEIATVKVSYSLDDVVLDDEIVCIKMGKNWYVLKDGAFTN